MLMQILPRRQERVSHPCCCCLWRPYLRQRGSHPSHPFIPSFKSRSAAVQRTVLLLILFSIAFCRISKEASSFNTYRNKKLTQSVGCPTTPKSYETPKRGFTDDSNLALGLQPKRSRSESYPGLPPWFCLRGHSQRAPVNRAVHPLY